MEELRKLKKSATQIFSTLEKTRLTLNFTHTQWADILELTTQEYAWRYYTSKCEHLGAQSLVKASVALDLSLELLLNPTTIDYHALYEHFHGNTQYVPERYTSVPYSKRRAIKNLVEQINNRLGLYEGYNALRKLQVNVASLDKSDENINIQLAIDLMTQVSQHAKKTYSEMGPAFFQNLGAGSVAQTIELPMAKELSRSRSVLELYEAYADQVRSMERNYTYRAIRIDSESLIAEAIQNEEIITAFKNKKYGSPELCTFKTGVIANITKYVGAAPLHTVKISCIHQGDKTCRWLVKHGSHSMIRQQSSSRHLSAVQ